MQERELKNMRRMMINQGIHETTSLRSQEEATEEETFKAKYNSTYLIYYNRYIQLEAIHDSFKSTYVSSAQNKSRFHSGFQLHACDTLTLHGDYY